MRKILLLSTVALGLALAAGRLSAQEVATAIFAGGCFWCVEADFDHIPGVVRTVSGYTGGTTANPTYEQVSAGGTGHIEAVEITYDPARVSYAQLLTAFWHSVDPTDAGGQFCDRGESYGTAIFVRNDRNRKLAESSKQAAETALGKPIVTPIKRAGPFYPAEEYHQDYYKKNPVRYKFYRWNCGRNQRVEEIWGQDAFKGVPGQG